MVRSKMLGMITQRRVGSRRKAAKIVANAVIFTGVIRNGLSRAAIALNQDLTYALDGVLCGRL